MATSPAPSAPGYEIRRARSGPPTLLSPKQPSVTLSRLQSGIGVLTIEAACSAAVGDLRLGCAYRLTDGRTSIVQYSIGQPTAPAASRRPVLIAERGNYERLIIDLRQSRSLDRLIVYGVSASRSVLNWGGTLVTTTFGHARIELPLDRPPAAGVLVMQSLYNVDGEYVLRGEMEVVAGSVRDACLAFGFDAITWLDPDTPLT